MIDAVAPLSQVKIDRSSVQDEIRSLGKQSVKIAWILADIRDNEIYRDWGYSSYAEYVKGDIRGLMSPSYAYQLSDAGSAFRPYRSEIEEKVHHGGLGISDLINGARLIEAGSDAELIAAALLAGHKEILPTAKSALKGRKSYSITIPEDLVEAFELGLTLHAINNNLFSPEDALRELAVAAIPDELDLLQSKFSKPFLEKYLPLIEAGKYYCRCCGDIPITPTLHHILPVSIGGGYGPLALLCWQPCHEHIVQPNWRHWAQKWLGKDAVVALTKEAKDYRMNHGDFPEEEDLWTRVI